MSSDAIYDIIPTGDGNYHWERVNSLDAYSYLNDSGDSARPGPVVKYRKSVSHDSDGIIPTDYSVMRSSRSGFTSTETRVYSNKYTTGPAYRQVNVNMWNVKASGTLTPGSAWFEDSHFGVFHPHLSIAQEFMSIPGFMQVKVHNKLLSKIDDQKIGLGTMVAELGETVSYVATTTRAVAKFGIAIATGRWNSALKQVGISKKRWYKFSRKQKIDSLKGVTESSAARWLEFNFAIKPTIGDLNEVIDLYKDPKQVLKTIKMRASASTSIKDDIEVIQQISGSQRETRRKRINGQIKAVAVYSVEDPDRIAQKALGINNVPAALWEGIPFSWLVDYVVGVGEFLEAITATEGLAFKYGYTSLKAYTTAVVQRTDDAYAPWAYYSDYTFSREATTSKGFQRGYIRRRLHAFPRPLLRFTLPDLSLRKATYVGSLAVLLKRKATNAGHF